MNQLLRVSEEIPQRALASILSLATFLVSEVRNIERKGNAYRESREMIPVDKVKDGPALARELRWRVRNALGADSGDEARPRQKLSPISNGGNKRRRTMDETPSCDLQKFRNFKPRVWDGENNLPSCHSTFKSWIRKDLPIVRWMEWPETASTSAEGDILATVNSTVDTVVKARQYTKSGVMFLERHKATRVYELWQWDISNTPTENLKTQSDL
jgi:F-box and leucine-rich repeat protein 10/11